MEKDYLRELNKEQYEAATNIDGPMLIIAGAGTGKTKTLVARVCYMLDSGIDPESILLLTFTNKAADEMKERVMKAVGEEIGSKITATTFHSFCNSFLRSYADSVGFKNNFIILDGVDSMDIIKMIAENKKAEYIRAKKNVGGFPKVNDVMKVYSMSVNDMIRIEEAVKTISYDVEYGKMVVDILEAYKEYKAERNMMDYDDLLIYTSLVLHNYENIRKFNDKKYKYIMCDEYQDTNIIQDYILKQLSIDYCNIAVVGDDNQSIYRFRGAKIENILSFEERYDNCKTVVLVENYRSTQEILDVSNALMEHALEGKKKYLKGQRNGEYPSFDIYKNEYAEAEGIVNNILKENREGTPLKDIAVIVRMSAVSAFLESKLNSEGIPYRKFGGIKFFAKRTVREIISFIRAALSDTDEIAWYMVLNIYPQIGSVRGQEFANKVATEGMDALLGLEYTRYVYWDSLQEVHDTITKLRTMNLQEQLKFLISGYYEDVKTRCIESSRRKETEKEAELLKLPGDIEEASALIELAEKYKTAKDFIDEMILAQKEPEDDGDYLNITTIHSAKGLEYNSVYLMNPINGSFPRSKTDSEDDREELRCLYVALTRAKNNLHICLPKVYTVFGKPKSLELSHHMAYDDVVETCENGEELKSYYPVKTSSFWDFRW